MGELQDRLFELKKALASCPSNFVLRRKVEDLQKMLAISDLQRKLQHQKSVLASIPSSSYMKSCVEKTEAQLTAAVLLAPAAERAPAQEAAQDEAPRVQKVGELLTQVDGLQSKVVELSKKKHTSFVSVQHLATGNYVPIPQRFKKEILMDRVKLMDFVQFAFKKEKDEDAPIEGTATEGFEKKETDVQVVQEHTDVIVENVDTAHEEQDERDPIVSETSLRVDLDNKTSAVDKSGEANNDDEEVGSEDEENPDEEAPIEDSKEVDDNSEEEESIEEKKSTEEEKLKENHSKKSWKKILRMKIIQLMKKRNKRFRLSVESKDLPEKSAAGPNVTLSSSSIRPPENVKLQHEANSLSPAAANSKPLANFAPNRNVKIEKKNYLHHPISEVEGCGKLSDLRAETDNKGEIIKKILAIEKYDEAEVQIKTLALLKKFLESHANPKEGNEVKENMT